MNQYIALCNYKNSIVPLDVEGDSIESVKSFVESIDGAKFVALLPKDNSKSINEGIGKYIAPLALSATMAMGNPKEADMVDVPAVAQQYIERINDAYEKLDYNDPDATNKALHVTKNKYNQLKEENPGQADAFARIVNRHLKNIIDYKGHQIGN